MDIGVNNSVSFTVQIAEDRVDEIPDIRNLTCSTWFSVKKTLQINIAPHRKTS